MTDWPKQCFLSSRSEQGRQGDCETKKIVVLGLIAHGRFWLHWRAGVRPRQMQSECASEIAKVDDVEMEGRQSEQGSSEDGLKLVGSCGDGARCLACWEWRRQT